MSAREKGILRAVPAEGEFKGGHEVHCRVEGCITESLVGGVLDRDFAKKALRGIGWRSYKPLGPAMDKGDGDLLWYCPNGHAGELPEQGEWAE